MIPISILISLFILLFERSISLFEFKFRVKYIWSDLEINEYSKISLIKGRLDLKFKIVKVKIIECLKKIINFKNIVTL